MAQVLVRNLDDRVVEQLKANAARHHRSLEAEVRAVLEEYSQRSKAMEDFRAKATNLRKAISQERGDKPFSDSVELIREDRER